MRSFILIILVMLSVGLNMYSQPGVSVECDDMWGPGRFNKVTVRINFSSSEGFARFTQDFPVGFEIVKNVVPDGDFTPDNTRLNLVWMKIPERKFTEFSYFVRTDAGMKGNFDLEGSLTIIKGSSERLVFQMTNKAIEIGGTNGILPEEMKIGSETEIVTNVTNTKSSDRDKSSGIILRIQIKSSSARISEEKIREEAGIPAKEEITIVKAGGIYKYQVGAFADYDKAAEMLKALKENGIRDAFIVAFRGSEQIPVSHVRSKK